MKLSISITFLAILAHVVGSNAGLIVSYWGQNRFEGSLKDNCANKPYGIVNLAFLYKFGIGRPPTMDLSGHCTASTMGCTGLSSEIEHCQAKGIKILLSLGGSTTDQYTLTSTEEAKDLATYIWNNFLGGESSSRPLGPAVLDGVDFDIEGPTNLYWDDLARFLSAYSTEDKKVYLSAAPQCPYPDRWLNTAIQKGLFDYVWIQFYNNQGCQYSNGDASDLIAEWKKWSDGVPTKKLFLGLPAAPGGAPSGGYIPPEDLINKVIPVISTDPKYAGVMLWSAYWDNDGYSEAISSYVNGFGNNKVIRTYV